MNRHMNKCGSAAFGAIFPFNRAEGGAPTAVLQA
jgi:hypothetical protein